MKLPRLLLLVAAALLPILPAKAEDEIEAAWLVKPATVSELPPADRKAREAFVKLIETRQAAEFRKTQVVKVLNQASGVPENYDVLLYREEPTWAGAGARFKVEVRAGQANVELISDAGIFRAQQPAEEIDTLTRQLAYAFQTSVSEREDLDLLGSVRSSMFATHTAKEVIQIQSREAKRPLHLQTPAWQPLASNVDSSTHGVPGFAHARLQREFWRIISEEGALLAPEAENQEILQRLKEIRLETTIGVLPRLEARIYGTLAAHRGLAAALPDLRRLELKDQLEKLEVISAVNPADKIKQLLRNERGFWVIDYAADPQHPERLAWIVEPLSKQLNSSNAHYIVRKITGRPLTPEQVTIVDKYFRELDDPLYKVDVAKLLLLATHKAEYFDYLQNLIRDTPRTAKTNSHDSRYDAAISLFKYAATTGKRREECHALLKSLLAELPADNNKNAYPYFGYADFIGPLGGREELPLLRELAQGNERLIAGMAIEGIADFDPKLATEFVHLRLERYLAGVTDSLHYSHEVSSYFTHILWQRDRAAIPLLQKAWASLDQNDLPAWGEQYNPQPVIDILNAQTVEQRTELTLKHFRRRHGDEKVLRAIGEQLIAEGADREKCKPLFQTAAERTRWGR